MLNISCIVFSFIADPQVFHVASSTERNSEIYRVHSIPAHDQWRHKFQFTAHQSWLSENDTMMFIYPAFNNGRPIISTVLYLKDSQRFPQDFFIAKRDEATNEIFELALSSNSSRISISNASVDCCSIVRTATFPVTLLPGKFGAQETSNFYTVVSMNYGNTRKCLGELNNAACVNTRHLYLQTSTERVL